MILKWQATGQAEKQSVRIMAKCNRTLWMKNIVHI